MALNGYCWCIFGVINIVKRWFNLDTTVFVKPKKEPTGFEPVRRFNTGSADFESAALPLCHSSITIKYYTDITRVFQV